LVFLRAALDRKEEIGMSFMFEVYYKPPPDPAREAALTERVTTLGGRFDCREDANRNGLSGICLTYEFDRLDSAQRAADTLRQLGEHVEGPMDYGP
jgi:hypothetical protein